jgi:D-aminopeptidase
MGFLIGPSRRHRAPKWTARAWQITSSPLTASKQLQELVPTVETAVVKHALAGQAARHEPPERVREAITDVCLRGTKPMLSGDVALPQTSPGHRLDIELDRLAAFGPPLTVAGLSADRADLVYVEVATWAEAWERLAFLAFITLRHAAPGVEGPDRALVADLRPGH